jgi:hypothetical protein
VNWWKESLPSPNLIINPQFESLCPPLSEERDAACHEVQEARAEANKTASQRHCFDSAAMFSQEYHQDFLAKNDGAETIYLISHDTL